MKESGKGEEQEDAQRANRNGVYKKRREVTMSAMFSRSCHVRTRGRTMIQHRYLRTGKS